MLNIILKSLAKRECFSESPNQLTQLIQQSTTLLQKSNQQRFLLSLLPSLRYVKQSQKNPAKKIIISLIYLR